MHAQVDSAIYNLFNDVGNNDMLCPLSTALVEISTNFMDNGLKN